MVPLRIANADVCLHHLLEAQAQRTPERPALAFEEARLSYAELDRRANQIAHRLSAMGLGPDMPVGLCVPRSLDMVVGIFGILKAGAAYLPIDPGWPRDRIAFMLEDSKVAALLTHTDLLDGLPAGPAHSVALDAMDWPGEALPPKIAVAPRHLAYVMYTSGTAGGPKGVCIEHRNIVAYVRDICERMRFEPGMNHAMVSTVAADLGNTAIFPALATGGCVHVVARPRAENQGLLAEYFLRERIDVLKIVPSHLAALQGARNPEHVMPSRRLILGGEAPRLDWIARLRRMAPQCEIHNHYGPTETTVGVATFRVGAELPATPSGKLPLGLPLPHARLYILDESGQPVPDGEIGELHIGGAGVARGYLNRPDLTAAKFVADPFAHDPAARMYRSGDLARRLPDGSYEFCGRIDDQVKRHGYRVELGEIEATLREHPAVRDAVVLAREDAAGGMQLGAWIVPQRAQQPLWNRPDTHLLPDGAPVAHLNRNETERLYRETFVRQAHLRHGIRLADGGCVVDAGANIGLFAVFANRVARGLRMLAFEPNPAAFACLKANAEAWGAQVKCLPVGLSREETTAELTFFEGLSLLSGFHADAVEGNGVRRHAGRQALEDEDFADDAGTLVDERMRSRTVSAQLRTLSGVMAEEGIRRIDLLKVKVERGELGVLLGIAPGDWEKVRQLVVEADRESNLDAIAALLRGQAYDVVVEQAPPSRGNETGYVYAARRDAAEGRLARQAGPDAHLRSVPPPAADVVTPAMLRLHLAARLPDYMLPTSMALLDALPLTANGKLDRQALPAPEPAATPVAPGHAEPRTEIEEVLAAIWRELLKLDGIGVHDDFFDLGGQPLLAIQAVSRVRDLFGIDMPASVLFENPTVAKLARVVAEARAAGTEVRRIERRGREGACALSFAQEPIWFLQQMAPESPVCNIVDVVDLPGTYAPAALDQAIRELMRRHEVLRAAFSAAGGRPAQNILPALVPPIAEVDLAGLPEAEARWRWLAIAKEEGLRVFDLGRPPLLRGVVVHFSATDHRLLLRIHRIVADEWSMELIQRELRQLYEAFCLGKVSPLPELPLQYLDFALWQREQMHAEALRRQAAWWVQELEGAPHALELPIDKRRPPVQGFAGACEVFRLPRRLRDRAQEVGMQEKATLFMVLEAVFAALLQRYSGQDDLLVGTPVSGRSWSETEALIGAFLNTVVLRTRFSGRMSFRDLLQQTRARVLGAHAHADLPFERLVAAIAPQRDPSRTPLFQAMFALHHPGGLSRVAQVGGALELETGTARFDLALSVSENADGLDCLIEYSTDLFEPATVRRMAGHYANLLEAATADPGAGLSHLAMLRGDELQDLIRTRNATAANFPERCVHELIEEQAWRTPERIAASFAGESLTYAELDRRAAALARRLRRIGLRPDVPVGLMTERSLEMLVAVLGILKAGCAYVPLDPAYPADRLAAMVDDSGMEALVAHRALDTRLPRAPRILVRLDDDADVAALPDGESPAGAAPESLAYVLYTSGSTGKPKGVAVSHAALVNFLLSMRREPGISEDDRLLAVTTLSFDIATLELFLPLVCGASVAIASREDVLDPALLKERMLETGCTVMQTTPTTWRALLNDGWSGSAELKILCGGEPMPPDLARALLPRCRELWNMYGPTETTVWSTVCRVGPDDAAAVSVPIGRPIANTQVFVLDAGRTPVPDGLVGELWIGGKGLARGYWRRDDLTRERFVRSPFAADERIYRTGDLARWLPDGRLQCIGRSDNQFKVRGFRVEAGEVETAMLAHPAVREAVASTCEGGGEARLVAWFTAAADAPDDMEDRLRALLRTTLPDYMVPSWFVRLPALPRTDNGKLDRKSLPAPADAARPRASAIPPRTATEAKTLALFQQALGRSDFGVFDAFFDLGGHSLMAVRLMADVRKAFAIVMPLRNLFERPTVAALSETIDELAWLASGQSDVRDEAEREEVEL